MFSATGLCAAQAKAPSPQNKLIATAYRTFLKEARFFDSHPLAKALLSASPYLRKDSSWVAMANRPETTSKTMSEYCGVTSNTLAMPSPTSMGDFVKSEFRNPKSVWDPSRFFALSRRLELAKKLHTSCSVTIPPSLPSVEPKLQLADGAPTTGTMLFAHPVLVDDFTQAAILVASSDASRTVGMTLNSDAGDVGYILEADQLNGLASAQLRKTFKPKTMAYFREWLIFNGGPMSSMPVVLHRSPEIAKRVARGKAKLQRLVTDEDLEMPISGELADGWYADPLFSILGLDSKVVKKHLTKTNSRVVMNHVEWETPLLEQEVRQNWWLATEPRSSCEALQSLLKTMDQVTMWQQAVANLGGDLSDFSRLNVSQEEEGEYRKLIRSTFSDDMSQVASTK